MSDTDTSTTTDRMEVQRTIKADPSAIFAVLRDPDGHVSIDASGMLMCATGDAASKVGDTFVVHMDREALNDFPLGRYDVTVEVRDVRAGPRDRLDDRGPDQAADRPRLRLPPRAGRRRHDVVTSYYDWSAIDDEWREAGIFPVIPESALRATLGILARTVTAST